MVRILLILSGLLLVLLQQYINAVETNVQFIIFITGVLFLGVPHGALDLLVASRNSDVLKKEFSARRFLLMYVARILFFGLILYFLPALGILLFILFSGYHFGETDLNQFKTDTLFGKLFVLFYGILILSVILLHHFDDVRPIYLLFDKAIGNQPLIDWLSVHRYYVLTVNTILFFLFTFIYFVRNQQLESADKGTFLVRLALLLLILFNLPLLLGFTFYFVCWHSLLSLQNILLYLKAAGGLSGKTILKQMLLYSGLAIFGVLLFGVTGFMFINNDAIAGYVFIGLAVLTAPHMKIMYDMYRAIRNKRAGVMNQGL